MISQDIAKELPIAEAAGLARKPRTWIAFLLIGFAIYLGIYIVAERLVLARGEDSRLFMIAIADKPAYDFAILGASHAMPLAYADMNERLEQATGTSVINLAIEGGGLVPARFLLDYFLAEHQVKTVVYVLDSFVFYSRQWNEERINDPKLMKRAPFDGALLSRLWRNEATRDLLPGYVTGFYKVNDADRFKPDISDNEGRTFERVYRPNAAIDRQRMAYLLPKQVDPALVDGYFTEFKTLADGLAARDIKLMVVKTPLPQRVLKNLKGEDEFNARIQEILSPHGFAMHDFSTVANEDAFFYDTDHLNKAGAQNFIDNHLAGALRTARE